MLFSVTAILRSFCSSSEIKKNTSLDEQNDRCIADTLNNIGNCLESMQQYDDALNHYKQSLEIKKNTLLDEQNDRSISDSLNNIG